MWRYTLLPQDDLTNEDTQAIFHHLHGNHFQSCHCCRVCSSLSLCVNSFHTSQGGCHTDLIKSTRILYFSFSSSCYTFVRDIILHSCHLHGLSLLWLFTISALVLIFLLYRSWFLEPDAICSWPSGLTWFSSFPMICCDFFQPVESNVPSMLS